jgi:excisionase family DNA binding protein
MAQLPLPFNDEPDPAPDLEYLTIAEAAARLRCCERTIRRAIDRGALRAGRVRGGNGARGGYRIRPADLDRWLFDDADAVD